MTICLVFSLIHIMLILLSAIILPKTAKTLRKTLKLQVRGYERIRNWGWPITITGSEKGFIYNCKKFRSHYQQISRDPHLTDIIAYIIMVEKKMELTNLQNLTSLNKEIWSHEIIRSRMRSDSKVRIIRDTRI